MDEALPLAKAAANYADERKAVERVVKVLNDPMAALSSKKLNDRQFAACVLVAHYRISKDHLDVVEEKAIPADESKRVLDLLSQMKWGEEPFDSNGAFSLSSAFYTLRLTEKDGWQEPKAQPGQDQSELTGKAAIKWLKDNAGTYQLRRIVRKAS